MNQELLRMGLLSPEMYADSSMVKANVNCYGLSRRGMTVDEFKEQAIEENGCLCWPVPRLTTKELSTGRLSTSRMPGGRLSLSPVDTGVRWRSTGPGKPPGLSYKEKAIADRGGFILARGVTHASTVEWKAVPQLLGQIPSPAGAADGRHRPQRR